MATSLSPGDLDDVLGDEPFDAVIHLAAAGVHPGDRDASRLLETNALLPASIVAWAARHGIGAVVIAGSSAEYAADASGTPRREGDALEAVRAYGASKAAGSALALAQGEALHVPVAVLRLFNVYGPGEAPHRLLPSLAGPLRRGERVALSAGTQVRDFIHVDDACDALAVAARTLPRHRERSGVYNLATGHGHSVATFARFVAHALDAREDLLDFGALPMRPDDLPVLVGDPARLRQAFAWSASIAPDAGIRASLADTTASDREVAST